MRRAWYILLPLPIFAQPLRVYSELARIDAAGEVSAPVRPREILSPEAARNAYTSLQIVVQVEPDRRYFLYIRQNPEDAVRITPYREEKGRLETVVLPYHGSGPQVFWMDLWVDRGAPVGRIIVEPQLRLDEEWFIYPMEVRVMNATVPDGPWPEGSAPPDAVMRNFLCGSPLENSPPAAQAIRGAHFRNARQDLALAGGVPKETLRHILGGCEGQRRDDPESYLRLRDYLFRLP